MASVQCTEPVEASACLKDNNNHDQHHDKAKTGHETAKAHCDGKISNGNHHVEYKSKSSSSSHGSTPTCHGKTEKKTKDKKEKKEKKDKKHHETEHKKEKKDKKCHENEHKKEQTHKKKCKDGKSGHSSSYSSDGE